MQKLKFSVILESQICEIKLLAVNSTSIFQMHTFQLHEHLNDGDETVYTNFTWMQFYMHHSHTKGSCVNTYEDGQKAKPVEFSKPQVWGILFWKRTRKVSLARFMHIEKETTYPLPWKKILLRIIRGACE